MHKNRWIIGFSLLGMLFGGGKVIFRTQLGLESGDLFWGGIVGFGVRGIGLGVVGVVVGGVDKDGYIGCFNKISGGFWL
uniref:branched-chain amino acid transport system II carrier protein n=1 Tax=Staphylococcus epidermidis TaxID=1282 RepID=UPI0016435CA2